MSTYTFGAIGCTHLGYSYRGMRMHRTHSRNLRVIDGYLANTQVMRQMIEAGCRGVLHGGDLFHWSRPLPRDIEAAHRCDDLRHEAGLWSAVNTGNHDAGAGADMAAVAVLDRPAMNSHAVYLSDKPSAAGPYPGLYEIHQPDPNRDLYLHVISHYGLDPTLREAGIVIDPQPLDHGVNILCSHGIFVGDDRLYRAVERHGADRLIPTEWVSRGWDITLLSDYHTPGQVEGFGQADGSGQVWYTGSTVRRGFADDESPRGWLKVEIPDVGAPRVSLREIWQRPQLDFDPIDARGLEVSLINDQVHHRLSMQNWVDDEAAELTGDGGWILRQRIVGATPQQKNGLYELLGQWGAAAEKAAYWKVVFENPLAGVSAAAPSHVQASIADRVLDFQRAFDDRQSEGTLAKTIRDAPPALRAAALRQARAALGAPQ